MELALVLIVCGAVIVTGVIQRGPVYNVKHGGGGGNYGGGGGGGGGGGNYGGAVGGGWQGGWNGGVKPPPKPPMKKPQPPKQIIPPGFGGPQYCWCAPKCAASQYIGPCTNCKGCGMSFCCSPKPPPKVIGPTATCGCTGRCKVRQTFMGPCPFCGNKGCDSSFCCNFNQPPPVGPRNCRCQGVCGYGKTIMGPCPWCNKDCTNKLFCCGGSGKKG